MKTEKFATVIYHDNCWDGLAAAWAVANGLQSRGVNPCNIKLIPAKYGDPVPEDITYQHVYIVDFSFDRASLLALNENIEQLVVLDHHQTAQEALEGLDFCIFDMERSGARMAWDFFFPGETPPLWLRHIEDRDLWKWEMDNTEEFTTWLFSQPQTMETLDNIHAEECNQPGENPLAPSYDFGKQMLIYRDQLVDTIAGRAVPMQLGEFTVYTVNASVLQSEVGHAIAKKYDTYAASYFHTGEGTVKFSLRSEGDRDVSVIAKLFGGGGHKNAAGFLLPEEKAASLFDNAIIKP